jgi:hypothetical protein
MRYYHTCQRREFQFHNAANRLCSFFYLKPFHVVCSSQRAALVASNNLGDFMEQPPSIDEIPPTVSVSAQNGVEDTTLQITGVSVFDLGSLASGSAIGVTLHVADGTLFLQTNVASGVIAGEISGEGTNTITITADQEAINATLAANGLIYTPGLNFNGNDTLTVTANDFRNAPVAEQATIAVSAVNDAPVLANTGSTVTTHIGASVKLEPHLTVSDYGLDSLNNGAGDYAGATFTIGPQGGGSSNDSWFVGSDVTISGSNLQIGGQTVATYSFNGSDDITFSFTSNATTALVNDFLQNVEYKNKAATAGSNVTLDYTFNDGAPHFGSNAGHSTATGSVEVDVTGPVVANAGPTVSVHGQTLLDPDLTVSDGGLDSLNNGAGNYAGATFTIAREGGDNGNDFFNVDTSTGITLTSNGTGYDAQFGGKTFATFTDNGSVLTIAFNSSETTATTDLVNGLLQHILYYNSISGSSVTLDYKFDDGSNLGHSTATASIQAEVTGPIFANESPIVNASPADGALLQPNLTVTDAPLDALNGGNGNYAGATFSAERDGGANPDDQFYWDPDEKNITISGNDLISQASGQTVATAGENAGVLQVSFTSSATTADVDEVLEHLGYFDVNATPPDSVTLDYTFNDGSAKTTGSVEFVACYCAGTLILTDRGEVAVETLQIGDRVITMSDVMRPIKWIGTRSYGGRFIMGRKDILPVCFKTGSLGDGVPKRDLWISPHHAMYLQGRLIEARDLVNDLTVTQAERVDEVEYFHIELESHDVIVAEGALSETFVDDDSRGMFNNAHEYKGLYPDAAVAEARYCAPRVRDGYEIEAVRQAIDARAGRHASRVSAPMLRGHIDEMGAGRIAGWAQNPDYPEMPVCLDILADGQLIGQVLANRYRADLEAAGLGSGRHGFEFIPPRELGLSADAVEVRRSLDGELLLVPRAA